MSLNGCKITVLSDNVAGASSFAEHGLSLLIEADKTLLFDAGASDLFLTNARLVKKNIQDIDMAILSHGHWDHGNGFMHLPGAEIMCHPGVFRQRFRRNNNVHIGLKYTKTQAEKVFKMEFNTQPFRLSEMVYYLGEIPRVTSFESKHTQYVLDNGQADDVDDEVALAVVTPKGLVILAGCSHAGICNIILHSVKVTGIDQIYTVMGGFHLKADNEITRLTIAFMKQYCVERVYPMHCTSFAASFRFYEAFKSSRLHTCSTVNL